MFVKERLNLKLDSANCLSVTFRLVSQELKLEASWW